MPTNFPDNVVDEFIVSMNAMAEFEAVVRRPLRPNDPNFCAGVFAGEWTPDEQEIKGIGRNEPTVQRYTFSIQTMVKHASEEEGIEVHNRLARRVRIMLYRDSDLRVRLGQLVAEELGIIERMQRWGVENQAFISNQLPDSNFIYLAVTNGWFETEVS